MEEERWRLCDSLLMQSREIENRWLRSQKQSEGTMIVLSMENNHGKLESMLLVDEKIINYLTLD